MVWVENFLVDDVPETLEGLLDDVFGFQTYISTFIVFDLRLCFFQDPKDIFRLGSYLDEKHFPKHLVFGNFQCLRCGLCCKNYECVPVEKEQVQEWELQGRADILQYVRLYEMVLLPEIYPRGWIGCPLCRKVRNKPYYACKIHSSKNNLPICRAYLCSKSIPVAHLNYKDVDELIEMIGLEDYYSLVKRDWGEEFDYSRCEVKTH
jgi:hypothetical protein